MRPAAVTVLLVAVLAVGCGSSGQTATPTACLIPAGQYLSALREAPGPVRLADETPISECLSDTQAAGAQADVGEALVQAATALNARARRDPSGKATVMLGYLVGAVQEGASHASGINADLVRRLDTAARFTPGGGSPGAAFERAFGKGYAAGQEGG